MEGLFWIVVAVVTIIAQVVKANRKGTPPPNATKGSPGDIEKPPYRVGADELQQFLQGLSKRMEQTQAQPPQPPKPVPPPVPIMEAATPLAVKSTPPVPQAPATHAQAAPPPPKPTAPVPTVVALKKELHAGAYNLDPEDGPDSYKLRDHQEEKTRESRSLLAELQSRRSVRRSIVLREILGPPIALRKAAKSDAAGC